MANLLTPRWYRLRPHDGQDALWHSKARFIVLPCGRRSGKSEIAKRKLILAAINPDSGYPDANYFAAAPTRDQASDGPAVIVNTSFGAALDMATMLELYRAGAISRQTILELAKNEGILPDELDIEAEAEKIEREIKGGEGPSGIASAAQNLFDMADKVA